MLDKNSIMLLNDIIFKIHTIENFDEMRMSVLKSLDFLIPSEISTFYLASDSSPYELARPLGIGFPDKRWELYLNKFQDLDYTRWTFAAPTAKAYRETELMNEDARINTPFYKEMYAPSGLHYCAILTIIEQGHFLGVISLYRKINEYDYSDDEMMMLELLIPHLNHRLYESRIDYVEKKKLYPSQQDLISQYHLTLREVEIVYLLLDGTTRDKICQDLCISQNTLKKHTINIYKKLEINSWRELFKLIK